METLERGEEKVKLEFVHTVTVYDDVTVIGEIREMASGGYRFKSSLDIEPEWEDYFTTIDACIEMIKVKNEDNSS